MMNFILFYITSWVLLPTTHAFIASPKHSLIRQTKSSKIQWQSNSITKTSIKNLNASKNNNNSGKGFGSSSSSSSSSKNNKNIFLDKSYGDAARPSLNDIIDTESAMSSFFTTRDDYLPLFRSIASPSSPAASSYLAGAPLGDPISFDDNDDHPSSSPWKQLSGMPTAENELNVIASVLDDMQRCLVDIPVNEAVKEDEADLHFIEEGRRILAITRFHVLDGGGRGGMEGYEELFATCWSEVAELRRADEENSGSLIVLPGYDLGDLRRFAEMNLHRPLDWLGATDRFEVTSLERGVSAIRLLHKLGDIPDVPAEEVTMD